MAECNANEIDFVLKQRKFNPTKICASTVDKNSVFSITMPRDVVIIV